MVSDRRREMTRMLIEIWNDRDFLIGVNTHLKSENDIEQMISYLNENKNLKSDEVLKKSMDIRYNIGAQQGTFFSWEE